MEAGEGLIEARAHALELVVRVTGDQTCYVALPSRVVGVLNAAAPHLPLPLALTPAGEVWKIGDLRILDEGRLQ